jgi:hypothetical protein
MSKCWPRRAPVDLSGLHRASHRLSHVTAQYQSLITNPKDAMTAPENPAQADIDADVASITADLTTLAGIFTSLQALVATAQSGNTPVDTTALDALVSQGASVVSEYQGLVPPAPSS